MRPRCGSFLASTEAARPARPARRFTPGSEYAARSDFGTGARWWFLVSAMRRGTRGRGVAADETSSRGDLPIYPSAS
jgi:hypothetical protein